jgi:hypothetical protein
MCTFQVALCVNNTDPRLRSCRVGSGLALRVTQPAAGGSVSDAANRRNLEAAIGALGLGVGEPFVNAAADLCGDPVALVVPLRRRGTRRVAGRRTLRVRATTATAPDDDTLVLRCRPRRAA